MYPCCHMLKLKLERPAGVSEVTEHSVLAPLELHVVLHQSVLPHIFLHDDAMQRWR